MRFFCLYYDRYSEATTSKALYDSGIEHTVLCHDSKEKFASIHGDLVETGMEKGIQHNMNYALDMLSNGEWCIFMSDDYIGSKKLSKKSGQFEACGMREALDDLLSSVRIADKCGVKLVGMNSTGNPLYSKKKFSKYGLVDGRCFAIKKTSFRFDREISTIPDYYATAYHLKNYGGNLVTNFYYLDFDRYKKKGLGTEQDRIESKIKDVKRMRKLFPSHTAVREKKGQAMGSHIIIKRSCKK